MWWSPCRQCPTISSDEKFIYPRYRRFAGGHRDHRGGYVPNHLGKKSSRGDSHLSVLPVRAFGGLCSHPTAVIDWPFQLGRRQRLAPTAAGKRSKRVRSDNSFARACRKLRINRQTPPPGVPAGKHRLGVIDHDPVAVLAPPGAEAGMKPGFSLVNPRHHNVVWADCVQCRAKLPGVTTPWDVSTRHLSNCMYSPVCPARQRQANFGSGDLPDRRLKLRLNGSALSLDLRSKELRAVIPQRDSVERHDQ